MNLYTRSHPIQDNEALVNYTAMVEGVPNLMTWGYVWAGREGDMGLLTINRIIMPYLAHMHPDEQRVVCEQIALVTRLYRVTAIDAYDDGFCLHALINGEDMSLVVGVLNMIGITDYEGE